MNGAMSAGPHRSLGVMIRLVAVVVGLVGAPHIHSAPIETAEEVVDARGRYLVRSFPQDEYWPRAAPFWAGNDSLLFTALPMAMYRIRNTAPAAEVNAAVTVVEWTLRTNAVTPRHKGLLWCVDPIDQYLQLDEEPLERRLPGQKPDYDKPKRMARGFLGQALESYELPRRRHSGSPGPYIDPYTCRTLDARWFIEGVPENEFSRPLRPDHGFLHSAARTWDSAYRVSDTYWFRRYDGQEFEFKVPWRSWGGAIRYYPYGGKYVIWSEAGLSAPENTGGGRMADQVMRTLTPAGQIEEIAPPRYLVERVRQHGSGRIELVLTKPGRLWIYQWLHDQEASGLYLEKNGVLEFIYRGSPMRGNLHGMIAESSGVSPDGCRYAWWTSYIELCKGE